MRCWISSELIKTSRFGLLNSDMIRASDVATICVSLQKIVFISPSPSGEGRGEGLADKTERKPLRSFRTPEQKKKRCGCRPLSPHPNPLPRGEGVRTPQKAV